MSHSSGSPPKKDKHYFPEIQKHIGKRIEEIIGQYKSKTGKGLQKSLVIHQINSDAQGGSGRVDQYMFSRMRRKGDVADEHIAKFLDFFSQPEFEPGFRDEVAAVRQGYLSRREAALSGQIDQPDALSDFDDQTEFYVYEAAFLWHDQSPPTAHAHVFQMSRAVEQTKQMLHYSIDVGILIAAKEVNALGSVSRIVTRAELKSFALSKGMRPRFLFPHSYQTPQEIDAGQKKLLRELEGMLSTLLVPIEDWSRHDAQDIWPVFEAAFLWHAFRPPSMSVHRQVMTAEIQQTKQMLHGAINAGKLVAAREVWALTQATRYLGRGELRRFAEAIGERPRFLFPEDESR